MATVNVPAAAVPFVRASLTMEIAYKGEAVEEQARTNDPADAVGELGELCESLRGSGIGWEVPGVEREHVIELPDWIFDDVLDYVLEVASEHCRRDADDVRDAVKALAWAVERLPKAVA